MADKYKANAAKMKAKWEREQQIMVGDVSCLLYMERIVEEKQEHTTHTHTHAQHKHAHTHTNKANAAKTKEKWEREQQITVGDVSLYAIYR